MKVLATAGLAMILVVLASCSGSTSTELDRVTTTYSAADEEARQYLLDNYPTRDEMLRVRACAEKATGYTFAPLPEDFGPELGLEASPELVTQALAVPQEVNLAFGRCVFQLGLEDSFVPPDQQQGFKDVFDSSD